MKLLCLQFAARHWFSLFGKTVGTRPHLFIIIPLLISVSLSTSIYKLTFYRNVEELFTSPNGIAARELKFVQDRFESGTPELATVLRETRITDIAMVLIMSKGNGNIFHKRIFDDIALLDSMITTFNTSWEGKLLNYHSICGKAHGECAINKVLKLASYIKNERLIKNAFKYPIYMNNETLAYEEYLFSLGGVTTDDKGFVIEAKAVRLAYIFDRRNDSKSAAIKHWLRNLNHYLDGISFESIKYTFFNHMEAEEELQLMTESLFPYVPIVTALIAIFAFCSSMTDNLIRSKPLVGVMACLCSLLAVASGFGLCIFIGSPFTDFHLMLAYSILAVEMDDAFVLIAAWRTTNPRKTVEERMKETYSGTGVSITITSLTNFISYCIGIFTPFPVVKYLCIYAATTTLFSYAYLVTFFGGFLALDGYREENEKHPLNLMCRKDMKEPSSRKNDRNDGIEEELFMRKVRDILGSALSYPLVKSIVMMLFLANLGIGIWGLKYLRYGNEFIDLLGDNSKMQLFMKQHYQYFNQYSIPIHIIIDYPLDYSDPKIQSSIEDLMKQLEAHPHLAESSLRISWLRMYKMFAKSRGGYFSLWGYNLSKKEDFIEGLHNVFLNIQQAKQFTQDIIFNENVTDIISSRFLLPTKDINDQADQLEAIEHVISIANQSPLPFRAFYSSHNLIEQAHLIKRSFLVTALVSSSYMQIEQLAFGTNKKKTNRINGTIVCIFCEMVGYMSLWGVKLDLSSLITLIACVGFSINYPTHMSFSYVNSHTTNSKSRIKNALFEVGMPIFQGSLSTLLGTIILIFQNYYTCRSTFKVVILMTVQTAIHSMFFIPVVLSLVGRCDTSLSSKLLTRTPRIHNSSLNANDDVKLSDERSDLCKVTEVP